MPFDLLHIVYLLLRFLVVYPKKHAVFSVVFHQKTKISVHIFCALFKHADFFLQFQCLVQIFLRFVRNFLSSVFRQRALCLSFSFFTCKNLLFRLFSQKKTLHNQNNSLVNARVYLMCKFFCVYFQLRQCRSDLNKSAKKVGFCTCSCFSYQFVHIVFFITPSPFSAQKACSYQRLLM